MHQNTARKLFLGLLWIGLIVYAFGFAPPNQPDTLELIQRLSTAQIDGINPLIVALFNIMGLWPVIYSGVLLFDGKMQKVKAAPFVVASFAVGAFGILPYLILREPNQLFTGEKTVLLKLLDSRVLWGVVAIASVLLVGYGITQGDWADFLVQWRTSRFIHVMSLDFCLLCLLFPLSLSDDMARRGWSDPRVFWGVSLIPLWGSAVYLLLHPPMPTQADAEHSSNQALSASHD